MAALSIWICSRIRNAELPPKTADDSFSKPCWNDIAMDLRSMEIIN